MKKAMSKVIGCLFLLFVSSFGFAQESVQARAEKQTQKLKTVLQLTEDQVARVQAATERRITQTDVIKDNRGGDKASKKENFSKLKTAMDEYNAEMKSILTPEQYTKFEEVREDKKERMMERRKNKKGK